MKSTGIHVIAERKKSLGFLSVIAVLRTSWFLNFHLLLSIILRVLLNLVLRQLLSRSSDSLLSGSRGLLDDFAGCLRDGGRRSLSSSLARTGTERKIVFLLEVGDTVANGAMVLHTEGIGNAGLINL
jgi:hypothetical protein